MLSRFLAFHGQGTRLHRDFWGQPRRWLLGRQNARGTVPLGLKISDGSSLEPTKATGWA